MWKFLRKDPIFSKRFLLSSQEEKKWVFDYLSSGKGTIPYEQINDYDSLNIVPDNDDFYSKHQFFSSLKDTEMSD